MDNANIFRQKMRDGKPCLGAVVTLSDHSVSEALSMVMDFLWIDMEHNPMTLKDVEGHIIASRRTGCAAIVRVPWNDPVLIKPVLDIGADGIIGPNIHNATEAKALVAACKYPPDGIRGYGPRRSGKYGRSPMLEYLKEANETVFIAAQLESIEAVNDIDNIVAVPGLSGLCFGPNDMSGTMGIMGQSGHPELVAGIERCIKKARAAGLFVNMGGGTNPDNLVKWFNKGAQWAPTTDDYSLMLETAERVRKGVADQLPKLPDFKA